MLDKRDLRSFIISLVAFILLICLKAWVFQFVMDGAFGFEINYYYSLLIVWLISEV